MYKFDKITLDDCQICGKRTNIFFNCKNCEKTYCWLCWEKHQHKKQYPTISLQPEKYSCKKPIKLETNIFMKKRFLEVV